MIRLRFRYTKLGKIRFIGHRDLARVWERALRRSGLPVASTEGFSPRPKLHFGLALSTGFESLGEYLDVDLEPDADQSLIPDGPDLAVRITPLLPEGIDVQVVQPIDRGQSLQSAVAACSWRIEVGGVAPDELTDRVGTLMATDVMPMVRTRKERTTEQDIRPSLQLLEVAGPVDRVTWDQGTLLLAELRTESPGLKVAELLELLAPEAVESRVCRTHQWIEGDGARQEPLSLATHSPYAGMRAS
jgi:radical SAM-linked protein